MLQIEISKTEIQAASYERFHHPSPLVQKRMQVIFLKALGYPHQEIAILSDLHPNSVTNTLKSYIENGLDGLKHLHYEGPKSDLVPFSGSIEADFKARPPLTAAEGIDRIEKLTGIRRKPTQTRKFMKKLGMGYRKMGHIPAKAEPAKQAEFLETSLEPLIEKAKQGHCHLFFVDAAHFVMGPFLCALWCFSRIFIQAPAGRMRYNVLGAIHAVTHQLRTITNSDYVNAYTVVELLQLLAKEFKDKPIILVMDNARYQRCKMVLEKAAGLNIQILFLPPYSPNLNIIERLWRWVKKDALYAKYYETFDQFNNGIDHSLGKVGHDPETDKVLNTLLNLKFQQFNFSQNQAA